MKRHGYYISSQSGRILRICEAKKRLYAEKFTDADLRGLTKAEKAFVKENGYSIIWKEPNTDYVMFISRDTLYRKRLYAFAIGQCYFPNWHDIVSEFYNYQIAFTYCDDSSRPFSKFNFEYRFGGFKTPSNTKIYVN